MYNISYIFCNFIFRDCIYLIWVIDIQDISWFATICDFYPTKCACVFYPRASTMVHDFPLHTTLNRNRYLTMKNICISNSINVSNKRLAIINRIHGIMCRVHNIIIHAHVLSKKYRCVLNVLPYVFNQYLNKFVIQWQFQLATRSKPFCH